jgi:hypothetical protein
VQCNQYTTYTEKKKKKKTNSEQKHNVVTGNVYIWQTQSSSEGFASFRDLIQDRQLIDYLKDLALPALGL